MNWFNSFFIYIPAIYPLERDSKSLNDESIIFPIMIYIIL